MLWHVRVSGAIVVLAALWPQNSRAAGTIRSYNHVFGPGEVVVRRSGGEHDGYFLDWAVAPFNLNATAGGGDEIHVNLHMQSGYALRFQPTGDSYIVEANLFNSGGTVLFVGTSKLRYSGSSNIIQEQDGTLDYETDSQPSWRGSKWASRSEFLVDPTQPGVYTDLSVVFTIPPGYPTANFAQVYMNLGVERDYFSGPAPSPMFRVVSVPVPEPSFTGTVALAGLALTAGRHRARAAKGCQSV